MPVNLLFILLNAFAHITDLPCVRLKLTSLALLLLVHAAYLVLRGDIRTTDFSPTAELVDRLPLL